MLKGLYALSPSAYDKIYSPLERQIVAEHVDVYAPVQSAEAIESDPSVLHDAEVILSGWGAPLMDEGFLAAAANLKAVFYGAGSVRKMVTDALWDRGVIVTSAYAANAVPVAEFCVSQILFSLKRGWHHVFEIRRTQQWKRCPVPGAFGTTVGLISLGMIGRMTLELLQPYDVNLCVYSTSMTPDAAQAAGVKLCTLDEIFRACDVVSLHTPNLPETQGMITGRHFAAMKPDSTFINTARGAVVNEPEMIEVLQKRPDIYALLDVTHPEPPKPGSPLYTLPNVVLTPHIAGSMDAECQRMGQYAVRELLHYVKGEPFDWQIDRETAKRLA